MKLFKLSIYLLFVVAVIVFCLKVFDVCYHEIVFFLDFKNIEYTTIKDVIGVVVPILAIIVTASIGLTELEAQDRRLQLESDLRKEQQEKQDQVINEQRGIESQLFHNQFRPIFSIESDQLSFTFVNSQGMLLDASLFSIEKDSVVDRIPFKMQNAVPISLRDIDPNNFMLIGRTVLGEGIVFASLFGQFQLHFHVGFSVNFLKMTDVDLVPYGPQTDENRIIDFVSGDHQAEVRFLVDCVLQYLKEFEKWRNDPNEKGLDQVNKIISSNEWFGYYGSIVSYLHNVNLNHNDNLSWFLVKVSDNWLVLDKSGLFSPLPEGYLDYLRKKEEGLSVKSFVIDDMIVDKPFVMSHAVKVGPRDSLQPPNFLNADDFLNIKYIDKVFFDILANADSFVSDEDKFSSTMEMLDLIFSQINDSGIAVEFDGDLIKCPVCSNDSLSGGLSSLVNSSYRNSILHESHSNLSLFKRIALLYLTS